MLTNVNYYITVFLKAKWLFACVMSLISTNQTIHHPETGDFYWMTVWVNLLIEFNMGTVHRPTVAVHFRYDCYMRHLANEFLCRNPRMHLGHKYLFVCLFVSSYDVSSHQILALIDSIWWVALLSVCTDVSYFTILSTL